MRPNQVAKRSSDQPCSTTSWRHSVPSVVAHTTSRHSSAETDEPLPVDLGQHVGGSWLRPRCAQEGSGEGRDPMGGSGEKDGLHLQPLREIRLGYEGPHLRSLVEEDLLVVPTDGDVPRSVQQRDLIAKRGVDQLR